MGKDCIMKFDTKTKYKTSDGRNARFVGKLKHSALPFIFAVQRGQGKEEEESLYVTDGNGNGPGTRIREKPEVIRRIIRVETSNTSRDGCIAFLSHVGVRFDGQVVEFTLSPENRVVGVSLVKGAESAERD